MNTPTVSNRQLIALAKTYWQWRWVWVASTVAFGALGLVYVLFLKSDVWVASQGLIVRDEANGAAMHLGRFQSQTDLKAAQETVLEMARNTSVVNQALLTVGREPSWFGLYQSKTPPTSAEIDSVARGCIEVRAPRGSELGTTEVIYLDVKSKSTARAVQLNVAVCDALENQLKTVREARAAGVVIELTTARNGATQSLTEATEKLQKIEAAAGADLSDLRGLTDSNSGGSTNRQVLDTIKAELRQVELQQHQLKIDMNLAKQSFDNPDHLLLTPSRLVANHAGLRKLREGLADAKIATSGFKGRFYETSPIVVNAEETEERIRDQLREELGLAIQTLAKDIEVSDQQFEKLRAQQDQLESRLAKLAEIRAEYSNIVSAVRARNQDLQEIERELAQATASRDAALVSSLVTRLDEPLVGESPIGPGRSTIFAGTVFGGLFFGLGIVFLLTPLDGRFNYGRRQNDNSREERRGETPVAATPSTARAGVGGSETAKATSNDRPGAKPPAAASAARSASTNFASLSDSPPTPIKPSREPKSVQAERSPTVAVETETAAKTPQAATKKFAVAANASSPAPTQEAVQALIREALKNTGSSSAK